jgi:FMN-dependent NADH-azoreductase
MNHLDTHIQTCAHYLGVNETHVISIDYQEFGDARHEASIADAFDAVPALARQMIEERHSQLSPA